MVKEDGGYRVCDDDDLWSYGLRTGKFREGLLSAQLMEKNLPMFELGYGWTWLFINKVYKKVICISNIL